MATIRSVGRRVARSPGVVGVSLLAVCGYAVVFVATDRLVSSAGDLAKPFLLMAALVGVGAVRLGSAPLLATLAVDPGSLSTERLRTAWSAVVVERAVVGAAVVVGYVVAGGIALAAATGVGYALYAVGEPFQQSTIGTLFGGALLLAVVAVVAGIPFRFAPALAVGGTAPRTAPTAGVRIARQNLRATVALATLPVLPFVALFGTVVGVGAIPGTNDRIVGVAAVVGGVTVGTLAVAFGAVYRAALVADADIDPDAPTSSTGRPDPRKLLAVALVVCLLVGGAGAVRVTETRPAVQPTYPVGTGASPDEVVSNASLAVGTVDHRSTTTTVRHDPGTREPTRTRIVTRVDRTDHQGRVELRSDEVRQASFFGGGTFALHTGDAASEAPDRRPWSLTYAVGGWTVFAVPGYRVTGDGSGLDARLPAGDPEWRVLRRTNRTVVVGFEGREAVERAYGYGDDVTVGTGNHVRVVVDRRTGYPRRVVERRNVTRADGDRVVVRETTTYREWRTFDLRRPEPLRRPSPVELLWDALEY